MNKCEVFNHFSKILDTMLEYSLFWDTYFQNPTGLEENAEGNIDNPAFPENLRLRFGITRGCLFDENYNYVVKFDVGTDNYGDSPCRREVDIYNAAKLYNLQNYFTEAIYIGIYHKTIQFYDLEKIENRIAWFDYDPEIFDKNFMEHEDEFGDIIPINISIPLYAYPKATEYRYTMFDKDKESMLEVEARSIASPLRKRGLQIAMEFIDKYGVNEYERLTNFLYEYEVNDLHRGNIGSINNELVIIDYAGYWSGDCIDTEDYEE